MFGGSQRFPYQDLNVILREYDQEELFMKYTGLLPDTRKRYHSIFRQDRTPDCRFEWRSGVLYFVDNAGYRGKNYFDIIGVLCELHRVNIPEAINIIQTHSKPSYTINKYNREKSKPKIKFKYQKWPKNNYFQIKPFDLENENVYLVSEYWIKKDDMWLRNSIHNPRDTLTIAYYFPDTDCTKLYWPMVNDFKWFSNCSDEIFGESKLDYYLERDNRLIIITKSQKDRLVLDYKLGIAAIAPQSETTTVPNKVIAKCKKFKNALILYDNDYTGQQYASRLSEQTGFNWFCLQVGKDAYDNINNLTYLKHEIYSNHSEWENNNV